MQEQPLQNSNMSNTPEGKPAVGATLRWLKELSASWSRELIMEDVGFEFVKPGTLHQALSVISLLNIPSSDSDEQTTSVLHPPFLRRSQSLTLNVQQRPKSAAKSPQEVPAAANGAAICTPSKLDTSLKATSSSCSVESSKKPSDLPSTSKTPLITASSEKEVTKKVHHFCYPTRRDSKSNQTQSDEQDRPVLIGDLSKSFSLPLREGYYSDLKYISCHTLARVMRGAFDDKVATYKIIDCRFPYEFQGGHIRGAQNLYMEKHIISEFLTPVKFEQEKLNNLSYTALGKRSILIFHCEFSSRRGPRLLRFLRNCDRERHMNSYPMLAYPEIYLLYLGYKDFFHKYPELCDPKGYRTMLDPAYADSCKLFLTKCKEEREKLK